MKFLIRSLPVLLLLPACREPQTQSSPMAHTTVAPAMVPEQAAIPLAHPMRPGAALYTDSLYADRFEFLGYDDNGDYPLLFVRRDTTIFSLICNWKDSVAYDYNRGDIITVNWKMDSSWVAGDGDRLELVPWAVSGKKITAGKVTLFRKKYNKPLRYTYSKEDAYTAGFLDELYLLVEYYLANSRQPLIQQYQARLAEADFVYSIENREEKGTQYVMIGISANTGEHNTVIQWLYIDPGTKQILEYDLAGDRLVPFD